MDSVSPESREYPPDILILILVFFRHKQKNQIPAWISGFLRVVVIMDTDVTMPQEM